mmetsp:Transcript_38310/g.59810  ORF Transcript_38310/g.59810 Transcript_38310/m.59810 type:complete len:213 (+) Transcript_38310:307-945(+)|eukprot:CAMPEP_0184299032 /NCGR_PEP_ID=MMETSP1049-20130417/9724_1 /TAXON_ID=77928 /ORGANISM="Proteomonas sulcata, Strain CCMP704" /LENGTH=212 /DNA_ID=CAMNT_0026609349 /DNA_START=316 /DNA_END=954 /DNA_ORIENTATION=+
MGNTQPKEKREDAPDSLVVRLRPEAGGGRRHEVLQVLSLEEVRVCRRKEAIRKAEMAQKASQKEHNMNMLEIQKMLEEDWAPENLTNTLNPINIASRFNNACCGGEAVTESLDKDEYHKLDPSELSKEEKERLEAQKRISQRFESLKKGGKTPPNSNGPGDKLKDEDGKDNAKKHGDEKEKDGEKEAGEQEEEPAKEDEEELPGKAGGQDDD